MLPLWYKYLGNVKIVFKADGGLTNVFLLKAIHSSVSRVLTLDIGNFVNMQTCSALLIIFNVTGTPM